MQCYDDYGHGTHVCGILCGSGELSRGKYRGIIPAGRLVVGKVLDENGDGNTKHMIHALDWIYDNRKKYNIRILNISVGIGNLSDSKKLAQLRERIERLWDGGVLVVSSAGNKGPADGSVSSIGDTNKAIIVGCCDTEQRNKNIDNCEKHSGRGMLNSLIRKPDLVAPGTNIVSCCHTFFWEKDGYQDAYIGKMGTSMATPIVTGCAALLIQKEPYLTNEQIKDRLHYTARDLHKPWNLQGWGMVDAKSLLENV